MNNTRRFKRKFNLKFLLAILLAMTMFSSSLTVYADPEGNGTAISGGKGGKSKVQGGVSENKSGYLAYITDESGGVTSDVVYIPYGSGASYSVNQLRARYTNTLKNRDYSGNMASATNGEFTSPPFTFSGVTYGGKLKKWMITDKGNHDYGVFIFLRNVFGMDDTTFLDNEYVLHVEAVAISRINPSAPSVQVAYTAYSIAKLVQAGIANDSYLNSFWLRRFQTCGMLEKSWGGLIVGSDMASNTSPYGVIQVRAKDLLPEDPEPDEPIEEEADDYIKANEINGQFTDLLADGADMRKYNQYEASLNGGDESFWKVIYGEHIRNEELKDGTWEILEEINSSILEFYGFSNGHIVRCADADHDTYKTFEEEKIFAEDSGSVYPGYGYQLSRSMFGEDTVICDYRAIVEGYDNLEEYLTDTLKMSWSHNKSSGKIIGVGKEGNIGESKTDTYSFTAYSVEKYEEDEGHDEEVWVEDDSYEEGGYEDTEHVYEWNEDDVVEKEEEVYSDPIEYEVSHTLYKYSPKNLDTATLSSAGSLIHSNSSGDSANRVTWATQLPNIMQVTPEVAYRFYNPLLTNTISASDKMFGREGMKVYAMGEKVRSCLPANLHGYYVRIPNGSIIGQTLLDAPAVNTNSKELSNSWGMTTRNQEYQVTAQGSGYSLITENAPIVEFATTSLDFYNGEVGNINPNQEFGSTGGQASHENFVDTVLSSLMTMVTQKRYTSRTGSSQFGDTYIMGFTESESQIIHHDPEYYWLRFENGSINGDDKAAVIDAIASAYNIDSSAAASVFSDWNLEGELQSMFETSAVTDAGNVKDSPNKWYDEQSIVLGVTINKTTVKWGRIYLDDKVDYGDSQEGDKYDVLGNGRKAVEAKFYYSLFYDPDISAIEADDSSLDVSSVRYLVKNQFIKGSEFLISNYTTMDN